MEIYGHRGAAGVVLENTVASIEKAIELRVDGIEFDVRVTRDSKAVVIHDETLERTHDVSGKIAELTLAELQAIVKDMKFPVPTLSQILTAIGNEVPANVELKEIEAVVPTLGVLNELANTNVISAEMILITSFDHRAVSLVREHMEPFKLGLLTREIPDEPYWQLAKSLDVYSVNISKNSVNDEFVTRAHLDGRKVMVYTVNEKEDAEKMEAMDVDAIFSDVPHEVRE